jgi:hypothetical protein
MLAAALIPFAAVLHVIGAMIGAGTTTFAELFYTKAASDGIIDHHERKYLRRVYHGLRIGMTTVLLSGFALIVLEYLVPNAPQQVLFAPFWAIQTLTLIVLVLGELLSRREVPWWFASAALLAGWWMILLLDVNFFSSVSYLTLLMLYVIVSFVLGALLSYLRLLLRKKNTSPVRLAEKT